MKKMFFALLTMLTLSISANAMSYEQARNEALFLTDNGTFNGSAFDIGGANGDSVIVYEEQNFIQIDLLTGFCVNQAVHDDV